MANLQAQDVHSGVAPVTVAASATIQAVTGVFGINSAAAGRFRLDFYVGKVVEAAGVTCGMQNSSGYGIWATTKTTSVTASTQKTFSGLRAEVTNTTWPAFASATQADYLHVTAQDGTTFAVWLDLDDAGTEPTGALYIAADEQIEVDIVTGDTAAQVAAKARAAVVANATWAAKLTTGTVSTASFTVTQNTGGAVDDPAPKSEDDSGAGSITVSVTTTGNDGELNTTTNLITSSTHGYSTDDAIVLSSDGTLPAGTTPNTIYYVQREDANTYKLRSRRGDAGSVVDLTSLGTGTHSATLVRRFSVTFNSEVAGDQTYLPLAQQARGYITTGAGDSCQVLAVCAVQPD